MDYKNFGSSRAWDLTTLSHEQYVQLDRDSLSPWLGLDGFRFDTNSYDWMRNIYLGTGRDFFASAVLTMVDRGVYSCTGLTDIDDILFHVEEQIRSSASFYKPLSFVKETVFKETLSTSFPFLLPSGNLRLQWK